MSKSCPNYIWIWFKTSWTNSLTLDLDTDFFKCLIRIRIVMFEISGYDWLKLNLPPGFLPLAVGRTSFAIVHLKNKVIQIWCTGRVLGVMVIKPKHDLLYIQEVVTHFIEYSILHNIYPCFEPLSQFYTIFLLFHSPDWSLYQKMYFLRTFQFFFINFPPIFPFPRQQTSYPHENFKSS